MLAPMPFLLMLESAFSLWMLYDATQRRVPSYWYFIILMPGGELLYFFAVMMKSDPKVRKAVRSLSARSESIETLQAAVDALPSVINKLRLAQGLHDRGRMVEAADGFRKVLGRDEDNKEALYGLALSCVASHDDAGAVDAFQKLVTLDVGYMEFAPGAELSAILWRIEKREEAIAMIKKVSRRSHRFEHEVQYAMFLIEAGEQDDAKELLVKGLNQYESGPKFAKKQDAVWAKRAQALLDRC
jgi:hypothetical protein